MSDERPPCGHPAELHADYRGKPWQEENGWSPMCKVCWDWHNNLKTRAMWSGRARPAVCKPPVSLEEGPGWFRKLANFAGSAVRHAWHGLPQTPTETQSARLALCVVCEHIDPDSGSCRKCGCPVQAKTSWAMEKCPVGKW
jgi:hypothetical protein